MFQPLTVYSLSFRKEEICWKYNMQNQETTKQCRNGIRILQYFSLHCRRFRFGKQKGAAGEGMGGREEGRRGGNPSPSPSLPPHSFLLVPMWSCRYVVCTSNVLYLIYRSRIDFGNIIGEPFSRIIKTQHLHWHWLLIRSLLNVTRYSWLYETAQFNFAYD